MNNKNTRYLVLHCSLTKIDSIVSILWGPAMRGPKICCLKPEQKNAFDDDEIFYRISPNIFKTGMMRTKTLFQFIVPVQRVVVIPNCHYMVIYWEKIAMTT